MFHGYPWVFDHQNAFILPALKTPSVKRPQEDALSPGLEDEPEAPEEDEDSRLGLVEAWLKLGGTQRKAVNSAYN